jgi:hypothetical protein
MHHGTEGGGGSEAKHKQHKTIIVEALLWIHNHLALLWSTSATLFGRVLITVAFPLPVLAA